MLRPTSISNVPPSDTMSLIFEPVLASESWMICRVACSLAALPISSSRTRWSSCAWVGSFTSADAAPEPWPPSRLDSSERRRRIRSWFCVCRIWTARLSSSISASAARAGALQNTKTEDTRAAAASAIVDLLQLPFLTRSPGCTTPPSDTVLLQIIGKFTPFPTQSRAHPSACFQNSQ